MFGLWKTDSYIKIERSKNHFSFCKYKKNQKENGFCGLFLHKFNKAEIPHIAKPMLAEVFLLNMLLLFVKVQYFFGQML